MDDYKKCIRDCKLGIKTYQNILASSKYFDRLCGMVTSEDFIVIASVFQSAVIRYAKPFVNIETSVGKLKYPIKPLKQEKNFSLKTHKHLMELRNTLIAHDDFEQIEPRILNFGLTHNDIPVHIPTSIVVTNKCISHPADIKSAQKMRIHVQGALHGVGKKLNNDVGKLRQLTLENPKNALDACKYQKNHDQPYLSKEGKRISPPNFMNDEWLNAKEPDFSDIHSGYRYEEVSFRRDFHGPETLKLPGGYQIMITPRIEK